MTVVVVDQTYDNPMYICVWHTTRGEFQNERFPEIALNLVSDDD